jgi:hypothetical protein
MKSMLFCSILFMGGNVFACNLGKGERVSIEEKVSSSRNIYLGTIESIKQGPMILDSANDVSYKMKVSETLKGEKKNYIFIKGVPSDENSWDTDFDRHQDKKFWKNGMGRLGLTGDCRVIVTFEVGKKYLVFPEDPITTNSMELIQQDNDELLLKVKKLLKVQ